MGLVRRFVDFGVFVQLYVAAAERERKMALSATAAIKQGETRERKMGRGARRTSAGSPLRKKGQAYRSDGLGVEQDCRRPPSLATPELDTETLEHHQRQGCEEHVEVENTHLLAWLFPRAKEGGRQAFNRHALCGGAANALITLDAALTILRDAGKVLPAERAWRWCCENESTLGRGRLLGFQSFVGMCEALKDQMADASIMSPEDHMVGASITNQEDHGAATAGPVLESVGPQDLPQGGSTGQAQERRQDENDAA